MYNRQITEEDLARAYRAIKDNPAFKMLIEEYYLGQRRVELSKLLVAADPGLALDSLNQLKGISYFENFISTVDAGRESDENN